MNNFPGITLKIYELQFVVNPNDRAIQIPQQIQISQKNPNQNFQICGIKQIQQKQTILNCFSELQSKIEQPETFCENLMQTTRPPTQWCDNPAEVENRYPRKSIKTEQNLVNQLVTLKRAIQSQIPKHRQKGSMIFSDNREQEINYYNPTSKNMFQIQDQRGHRSLRSDVLYKTISRDMRKFYSKDFNAVTGFIIIKNRREKKFFLAQIEAYLKYRFPEFHYLLDKRLQQSGSQTSENKINEIVFFFGCLIYPKEMHKCLQTEDQSTAKSADSNPDRIKMKSIQNAKLKSFHESLYQFSLQKLYDLICSELYAYFFCHYFQKQIIEKNHIETKCPMNQHKPAFVIAYNLLLRLSQLTLVSSLLKQDAKTLNEDYLSSAMKYLQQEPKTLNLFRPENNPDKNQFPEDDLKTLTQEAFSMRDEDSDSEF
ncbi:UNKNOWN [Stylonychia lemnae]|uniref:Uncharacterized protein n=1 Tax=Stylonychia lemnae TaxID=5949 RepID=A0A078AAC8_STYLE|nr:UNKNOWN [Stylonychia lemnae]|eukprot:CDW79215.1 UNKNOWN [Stylonychia lemnae]